MASTTLVRECVRRISVALQDISPQFVAFKERDIIDALNDGRRLLAVYIPQCAARLDAVKLVPGALQSIDAIASASVKPVDGSTPPTTVYGKQLLNPICMMGSDGATPGKQVRVSDNKYMAALSPAWMTQYGEPREVFFDPMQPRIFWVNKPIPLTGNYWMLLSYIADPTPIPNTGTEVSPLYAADGSNTTKIGLDDMVLDDLVNYVVARMKLTDPKAVASGEAAGFVTIFTGGVNAKAQAMTGVNPNLKRLPMTPGGASQAGS